MITLSSLQSITTYNYDSAVNSLTTFAYDFNGNLVNESYDLNGDGIFESIYNSTYDENSNLIALSSIYKSDDYEYSYGQTYAYDDRGNLISETFDSGLNVL